MRVAVIFSLFVATLPSSSIVSAETFTRVLSLLRVGSLLRAFWICVSRSESLTAAMPFWEPSAAGFWVALAPAAPATPPVAGEAGAVFCAGGSAVPVGFTCPLGLGVVEVEAGVPALVWAPL